MKQKILNFITVIMIIATLTFSNFLLLGVNAVSYAADAISILKKTNNKNVEFILKIIMEIVLQILMQIQIVIH